MIPSVPVLRQRLLLLRFCGRTKTPVFYHSAVQMAKRRKAQPDAVEPKTISGAAPATRSRKRKGTAPASSGPPPSRRTKGDAEQENSEGSFWLLKSEPDAFSIDNLASSPKETAPWDGVRNHTAKNNLLAMRVGDRGFFYHSNCKVPCIVGVVEVAREGYADHTSWDSKSEAYDPKSTEEKPRWFMVDVKLVTRLKRPIPLSELRMHSDGGLKGMQLLTQGRLSVQKVTPQEWDFILGLADQPPISPDGGSPGAPNKA